jgi:tetratricopeptide (TPR) repeat protein
VKEVAAAPDGGVWVVSENRPIWRIALWVAPPLIAVMLVLVSIGALAVVWAGGASKKRWAAHRAAIAAAGIVRRPEDAETEKTLEKRDRALWWKLPAFLAGFPFMVKGVEWSRLYFEGVWAEAPGWVSWAAVAFPIVAVLAFLAVRWLRQWSKPMPALSTETLLIRLVLCLAVVGFFLSKLPSEGKVNAMAIAVVVVVLLRNSIAARLTNPLLCSGQYDRALARLRWLSLPRPTALMTFQRGALLGAAGRHAEAEQCYREVLAVSANAKPEFRNRLLLGLGYTLSDLGRYEEGQRCFEVLIDLGDPHGGARLGIADLLLQQSREAQRALSMVEESMRICSAGWYKAERMGNKAWALALMGKREEISEPLAAALQGARGLQHVGAGASIHWRVGKALAAAERVPEAMEQFRAAFQIDPHGHHGLLARKDLLNYGTAGV